MPRKSAQRLVLEVLDQRRNFGASRGQENRHQRQCVRVAGIPMMNGSNVLEGYVPDVDATTKQLTGDKCLDHPKHALQNEKSPSSLGK